MNAAVEAGRQAARWLARFEFVVLSLAYVYFVVTDSVPVTAFLLIGLLWLLRWATTGTFLRRTPLDLPIALILLWLPISLWVSTNWWLSLPKVYGVLFGAVFFFAVAANVRSKQDLVHAAFWLALVCGAIALAGLVGTDWAQGKILSLSFVYDRLPRFIQGIPRSIAGGFARNGVGGTLTLTIPLVASLLVAYLARQRESRTDHLRHHESPGSGPDAWNRAIQALFPWALVAALALSLVTLGLTQSRGAILGTAAGILALGIWRERRAAWLIVALGLGLIVAVLLGQGNTLIDFLLRMDAKSGTLASRLEVWQRGIWMVQDFPLTGIGIGTYNEIAHSLYPFFIAGPDEVVAHAHNNLLEVAVDLGVPGLVAFVGLLAGFVILALRAYRAVPAPEIRALLVGLVCGMLAHQVFGLTDAFILGTKPGVLLWVFMGLAVAIYQNRARSSSESATDD